MINTGTKRRIKKGQMKDKIFIVEGTIADICGSDCLPELACFHGNWAARNALEHEKYTIDDAPFYYGKIGTLGFIFAEKDLETIVGKDGLKNSE